MSGIWGLIAAFAVPTLVSILAILFRHTLKEYITSGIRYSFDREIEKLRADLSSKEREIAALREGALSGLSNRRALLTARKLEAVDQLWAATVSLSASQGAAETLSVVKLDNVNKRIETDSKLQLVFKTMSQGYDLSTLKTVEAERQRPFLTLRSWALFSAYRVIIAGAVSRLTLLANGSNTTDLFDEKKFTDVLKAALPHQSEYIDNYARHGGYALLSEIENALLLELGNILDGREDDQKAMENAREILDAVRNAQTTLDQNKSEKLLGINL